MKNLILTKTKLCLWIGLGLLLNGCGQSGPLYLPKQPTPTPATNNKTTASMPSSTITTQVDNQNNTNLGTNSGMPTTTDPS